MSKEDIIKHYKESIEWYKREVEWCNKEIEWLGKEIKREKYDWGYSAIGEIYRKRRNKMYRDRKKYKEIVEKYEKILAEY